MKKLIIICAAMFTAFIVSCNNGDTSDAHKDTANTLQDTFPAGGFKDSMPPDSNPPDATHVDSINKVPH